MSSTSLQAPPPGCQCNAQPIEKGRNLVVCIDGTSNVLGENDTNVVKLFAMVDRDSSHPEQLAFYASGIGTYLRSFLISQGVVQRLTRGFFGVFDKAFAWNVEKNIKVVYHWLSQTYQKGDRIYLFGFSRGAYQVRVLAAMIYEVGLINMPTKKLVKTAYDNYEAVRSGKPRAKQVAGEFKTIFSRGARVHFVGVWDTVSSVGLARKNMSLSNSSCTEHARYFRHALALDEHRVMFMPEYFHEMNSLTDNGKYRIVTSADDSDGHTATIANEWRESTVTDTSGTYRSREISDKIKEVWFAGSHSDVGGKSTPGKLYHTGKVSLSWMRREAAASGLVLKPSPMNVLWVPDDLDFGINNSMNRAWRAIEYMPIRYQVSFSGVGKDAQRMHRLQPRRIIPGQKVHASILYANAYRPPHALLTEAFDLPIVRADIDMTQDDQFWETGLFDDSADDLLARVCSERGVAPIYLDRLLFMLRSKEGRQCIRDVKNWQDKLIDIIHKSDRTRLIKLIAIIAYYEASRDSDAYSENLELFRTKLSSEDTFNDAKKSLHIILAERKHRDGHRVAALLMPLTRHQELQKRILTEDVLKTFINSLDTMLRRKEGYLEHAIDGLNYLLQCEGTQEFIVEKLEERDPDSNTPRIKRLLEVKGPRLLTAALRMVMTLAQIPLQKAKSVCSSAKHSLRQLARCPTVGVLAVEILFVLYQPNEEFQLNIHDRAIRENIAVALVRSNINQRNSGDEQCHETDHGQHILCKLFGLESMEPSERQKELIKTFTLAVVFGAAPERTAATLTLLKLCETPSIRTYFLQINLLDDFVRQLWRKDTALLAAYALAACLKYPDMKELIMNDEILPGNIVRMLREDYFDDAVGMIEGFQIFGDFMRHAEFRKKIKNYNITEILYKKLLNADPRETRTSQICLDISRTFDQDDPWTHELVGKGLQCLQNSKWKVQKAGVTILSSLSQTEHGVAAISPRIKEIINMLLPEDYHERNSNSTFLNKRTPCRMMGPLNALRVLAQNKTLRDLVYNAEEYKGLKKLHLSGTLISEADTKAWRIKTPNKADVTDMLEKMIKVVDEELLEEDSLMSIGSDVLPHIKHWSRLLRLIIDMPIAVFLTAISLPLIVVWATLALMASPFVLPTLALIKRIQVSQVARKVDMLRGPHRNAPSGHGDEKSWMTRLTPKFMRNRS